MTSEGRRPLASVIVLGFNGREFLEDCLSSLLDQDLPPAEYEVVYVDNASRDGSVALVRNLFPQIPVVELDHNYGYAEGMNIGFRNTRGHHVVFLNQDTVLHRSWLRELIAGVQSAPDIMAAHSNVIQPWYPEFAGLAARSYVPQTYTGELTPLGYVQYRCLGPLDAPADVLLLHGVSVIIRRVLADEMDYVFDPDFFAYAEDIDLGLRVRSLGYRCVVVPRSIVYHKHRLKTEFSWSTLAKTVRIIRNRYLAFYKVMSLPEFAVMAGVHTVGSPFNAGEFGLSPPRRVFYGLALVPVTFMALLVTLWHLPKFARKRSHIRGRAAIHGAWCLKAVVRGVGTIASQASIRGSDRGGSSGHGDG